MGRTGCYSLNACRFLSPSRQNPRRSTHPAPRRSLINDRRPRTSARREAPGTPRARQRSPPPRRQEPHQELRRRLWIHPGDRARQPPRPGHLKERLRRRVSRTIRVVDECPNPSRATREPAPASLASIRCNICSGMSSPAPGCRGTPGRLGAPARYRGKGSGRRPGGTRSSPGRPGREVADDHDVVTICNAHLLHELRGNTESFG